MGSSASRAVMRPLEMALIYNQEMSGEFYGGKRNVKEDLCLLLLIKENAELVISTLICVFKVHEQPPLTSKGFGSQPL